MNVAIRQVDFREAPKALLLLADPSPKMIQHYLPSSIVFVAKNHHEVRGCLVLQMNANHAEIMNVAVNERFQKQGIGSVLIEHAIQYSRDQGVGVIKIGTADTSTSQIRLYQRLGFRSVNKKTGFFLSNYETPIFENGRQARDMIVMEKCILH